MPKNNKIKNTKEVNNMPIPQTVFIVRPVCHFRRFCRVRNIESEEY